MKDLMMYYGVLFGKRFNQKQKQTFYNEVSSRYQELGYSVELQSKQGKYFSVNNIVIGDLNKVHKIIVAGYDTPSKSHLPNYKYYPFNTKKNLSNESFTVFIQFLISCLLFGIMYFILKDFGSYSIWLKVGSIAISIILVVLAYLLFKAQPNPVNFNRNSASLAIIHSLLEPLKNMDTAFVLLDHAVTSFEGLKLLKEKVGEEKEIIVLDCLASGEKVVVAHHEEQPIKKLLEVQQLELLDKGYSLEKAAGNVLHFFPKMLYFVSGTIEKGQFLVKNTRSKKDIEFDLKQVEGIRDTLIHYCRKGE